MVRSVHNLKAQEAKDRTKENRTPMGLVDRRKIRAHALNGDKQRKTEEHGVKE